MTPKSLIYHLSATQGQHWTLMVSPTISVPLFGVSVNAYAAVAWRYMKIKTFLQTISNLYGFSPGFVSYGLAFGRSFCKHFEDEWREISFSEEKSLTMILLDLLTSVVSSLHSPFTGPEGFGVIYKIQIFRVRTWIFYVWIVKSHLCGNSEYFLTDLSPYFD